ncbi:MAG: NAD(P)-dependent glycerol-3-phosphate dehydrogenase [Fimbriimonadaceae bacterium]|nr:NAD(P)-dependent glycerol-3-phosphate dehydrogenase [Fimbriimonadaceae bacterium]
MTVTVLGAGSWGTALAILLARNGHPVRLAGRERDEVEAMRQARENLRYLPGFAFPDGLEVAWDGEPLPECGVWIVAVPSNAVREVMPFLTGAAPRAILVSKGLEPGSAKLAAEVAAEVRPDADVAVLSGPNLAVEVARKIPTVAVAAARSLESAREVALLFNCGTFRVYLSDDVRGVELAGALKNVLAIGAGISDGLGFGDNTKGALLARGLREMTRLGVAMGARVETFMGVAGVGDLFATAASSLSRNYRVGRSLGEGRSLADALEAIGQVAEGVPTSAAAVLLGRRHAVETPIFETIHLVIHGQLTPMQGVAKLMENIPKPEGFPTNG